MITAPESAFSEADALLGAQGPLIAATPQLSTMMQPLPTLASIRCAPVRGFVGGGGVVAVAGIGCVSQVGFFVLAKSPTLRLLISNAS